MPAPAPAKKGGGMGLLTQKFGPLPLWGWLAIGAVALYVYRKNSSGGSSSSAAQQAAAAQLAAAQQAATYSASTPTETLTTAGGTYSGPAGYAPGSVANPGNTTTTPGTTSTATPGSGGNSTPGYGEESIGGQQYVTLGTLNPGGSYSGYNVGGNAPVYFLTPGSTTPLLGGQNGFSIAGAPGGTQVLTPTGYAGAVSAKPTTEHIG